MDTMYERCCGLDIHKKTIEACFRSGKKKTHMSFGTTSAELRKLTMWLVENDCQSVAMESTGSYWNRMQSKLQKHRHKVLRWKVLALTGSQSLTFWSYLALT